MNMWQHLIENLPMRYKETKQHVPPIVAEINNKRIQAERAELCSRISKERSERLRTRTYAEFVAATEGMSEWTVLELVGRTSVKADTLRRLHKKLYEEGALERTESTDGVIVYYTWRWK